ncbi:MAG: hypothetical protein H6737_12350 [Alphaproteobacteria bacterium]|nr:hypothetical protein [Alphaproteobacteria bacterium]
MVPQLFTVVAALTSTSPEVGRTLAVRDDGGVAVLTWTGETARFYRRGELLVSYPAETWEIALWNHVPGRANVTAPHFFDRALTDAEVVELQSCDWAPSSETAQCGPIARCDCE